MLESVKVFTMSMNLTSRVLGAFWEERGRLKKVILNLWGMEEKTFGNRF